MSVTAKGKRWELLHSLWIGWAFSLLFYWVAFIYIGFRAEQRKWILWGSVYAIPFVLFIASLEIWGAESWQSDVTGIPTLLLGVISIFHAFIARKEYLLRLEALSRSGGGRGSISSRGSNWDKAHSLWIGWTFTLVFNWVAFLYIGFRTKRLRWILWGLVYLTPLVVDIATTPQDTDGTQWDLTGTVVILAGVISVIHALRIRKEYLLRLEALQHQSGEDARLLKSRVADDYRPGYEEGLSSQSEKSAESSSVSIQNSSQAVPVKPPQKTSDFPIGTSDQPSPRTINNEPELPATSRTKTSQSIPTVQSEGDLDYRISSSYPFPIAFGFRSLVSIVDYRDLYREQLRIAENTLAFLASVSLTLLREEDRQNADIDIKGYWRSGISPGDWKDIVGRCSKVFAAYEDNPLALEISRLNIRLEKKGFGQDIAKLVQAKNDYKHDRGPTILEDFAEASRETQERLRQCMERLAFFSDYPIRQVEDFNVSRSGNEVLLKCLRYMGDHPSFPQEEVIFHKGLPRGDLFLDLDGRNWVPLYPFIVPMTCLHCKARETYFVDLWDTRRGMARMKSFERGHTTNNTNVSEHLAEWG